MRHIFNQIGARLGIALIIGLVLLVLFLLISFITSGIGSGINASAGAPVLGVLTILGLIIWGICLWRHWRLHWLILVPTLVLAIGWLLVGSSWFDAISKGRTEAGNAIKRTIDPKSFACTVTLPAEKFWEEQPFTCDGKKPEGKFRMDIQDVQLKILKGDGTSWGNIHSLKISGAASPKSLFSRYRGSGTPTTRDWAFLIDGIPPGENVVITAGSKFSLNIDEDQLGWMKKLATKLDKPVQILVKLEQ